MSDFYPGIHELVQRYFPGFDYNNPTPPEKKAEYCDYSNPNNQVGHQQRAVTCYWALKMCGPLDLGLDLGSTCGLTPLCIHLDKFARGEPHPHYSSKDPVWSDVVGDLTDLSMFPKNRFPCVVSNHSIEHADVSRFISADVPRSPDVTIHRDVPTAERKAWIAAYPKHRDAYDQGLVKLLRQEWIRVVRPGGILAMVVPDQAYLDILGMDADHRHAWTHGDFEPRVLRHLTDLVEVVEFDSLKNKFSFNVVLRKKAAS